MLEGRLNEGGVHSLVKESKFLSSFSARHFLYFLASKRIAVNMQKYKEPAVFIDIFIVFVVIVKAFTAVL